jgi:hypothetical protein
VLVNFKTIARSHVLVVKAKDSQLVVVGSNPDAVYRMVVSDDSYYTSEK